MSEAGGIMICDVCMSGAKHTFVAPRESHFERGGAQMKGLGGFLDDQLDGTSFIKRFLSSSHL